MPATITVDLIKKLRERTGIGMAKCKEALQECGGDIDDAIAHLRKQGLASAVKKEGRETNEGKIAFAENSNTIGLVEVNAETDFVVNNETFKEFSENIANELIETKPESLEAFLEQTYSKDSSLTIDEYRGTIIQKIGENIQLRRIQLFEKSSNASFGLYSHNQGKIFTVVELEGSSDASEIAKEVAMHVAAEAPDYLNSDQIPEAVKSQEEEIARTQLQGKPENIMDKIISGKMQAFYNQVCLINQKFIKDPDLTVEQFVQNAAKDKNATLKIKSFLRWSIAE
jgi:elongation factor Ts